MASCAVAPPQLVKFHLPAEFKTCGPRPAIPLRANDKTAAVLLLEYDDALSDCHGKLYRAWKLTQ